MTSPGDRPLGPREILERLVAFPTVSRDTNLPLVDWLQGYLAGHGIDSHRVMSPCGTKAHPYAQVGPDAPGGVILSGHTDVVPVDGQAWTSDPWQVVEKDGKLYGRGTCDMKGFDALAIWALVRAAKAPLTKPLQLALSYDEEVGCTGAPPMLIDLRLLTSRRDTSGWSSRRETMVGTAVQRLILWRSIKASTSAGS